MNTQLKRLIAIAIIGAILAMLVDGLVRPAVAGKVMGAFRVK